MIAATTGQSQSEISEILKGRQVQAYNVLVRICEGLAIPREAMGLSFTTCPVLLRTAVPWVAILAAELPPVATLQNIHPSH